MDEVISFGDWIKQRRQALRLSQDALAQRLSVAFGTLRKWESDERRPSPELAAVLAEVLAVPPEAWPTFVKVARGELALEHLALAPDPAAVPREPAARPRGNLAVQRAPLIGRERELADVCALLLRGDAGLVTLTGPGGTGKTRLALQVAADVRASFADGVWLVDLAPIGDPGLFAATIAGTLGVKETGGQPLQAVLQTYVQAKRLLLVLDNFEQIVAAAPLLADLLAAAPDLKVLVTSREVLHVSGEHEYPLAPLALPDPRQVDIVARVTQSPAGALFIARAQAVQRDFAVTPATAQAIAAICRRLDGLPLAIELAAARIKVLTPQDLLRRLEQQLPLLTGGSRDLPARQQTIRATLDWSYALLDAREQALFRRLGLFVGGFALAAAEAVAGSDAGEAGDLAVVDGLHLLMDKSLLQHSDRATPGGEVERRFTMLELIREYALAQLEASGEAEELWRAYAAYYLSLAEAGSSKVTHRTVAWFQTIAAEHDNLRAVLTWSLARGEVETALRLGGTLGEFWNAYGHWSEGRGWLENVLRASRPAQGEAMHTDRLAPQRAQALRRQAWLALLQGDLGPARALEEEALVIARVLGDTLGLANVLLELASIVHAQGDTILVRTLSEEALALFQELGARQHIAGALNNMGWQALLVGEHERALVLLEESLALSREFDNAGLLITTLNSLGLTLIERGEYGRAQAVLEEGGRLARQQASMEHGNLIYYLEGFAWLAVPRGAPRDEAAAGARRAARLFGASEARCEVLGFKLIPAEQVLHARHMAAARAHVDEAAWQAAWAEGRAMPLEQAIAYALEEGNPE